MKIDRFLNNLRDEVDYQFGTPWRYNNKSLGVMIPILKRGDAEERIYITLEEATDQGVTFRDTGRIDRVIIDSSLEKPIFIRSGTTLKSTGTQSRAVESSIVVIPRKEKQQIKDIPVILASQEIPVRCIYASKGIRLNEKFSYGGDVPLEVRAELLSRRGQLSTWSAVGSATNRFMSDRSYGKSFSRSFGSRRIISDNLVGVMEEVDKFTANSNEILAKTPLFEDQVGAAFLDMKDVIGLEMFDHPKSWEAIHKEVEKRLGESLAKEEDTFFKPDYEKIKPLTLAFLKKLLDSEKTETSNNDISTITLKGDGVIGEATAIDGKIIHIVGIKDEKKAQQESNNRSLHATRSTSSHTTYSRRF